MHHARLHNAPIKEVPEAFRRSSGEFPAMSRSVATRLVLLAFAALALAGCVVEPGYYHPYRPHAEIHVRPAPAYYWR